MANRVVRWLFPLLCVSLLHVTAQGLDRKGRLVRQSAQPMTMRHGKVEPLPGELELTIDRDVPTLEGDPPLVRLRLSRPPDAQQERDEPRYLAYPAGLLPDAKDVGKPPEKRPEKRPARESVTVEVVDEPRDSCLWKMVQRSGKTRYLSLLELEAIQAPRGPYAGWELRFHEGQFLLAKPGSDIYQKSAWVGPYREFDNLDDGK